MRVREILKKDAESLMEMRRIFSDHAYALDVKRIVGRRFFGVYVVGNVLGRPVKIGVATNPKSRLSGLQVGNATELFFHHLYWVEGESNAFTVESYAHKLCGERHQRLVGEWFLCNDYHAADMVELACVQAGVPVLKTMPEVDGVHKPFVFHRPPPDVYDAANDNHVWRSEKANAHLMG